MPQINGQIKPMMNAASVGSRNTGQYFLIAFSIHEILPDQSGFWATCKSARLESRFCRSPAGKEHCEKQAKRAGDVPALLKLAKGDD